MNLAEEDEDRLKSVFIVTAGKHLPQKAQSQPTSTFRDSKAIALLLIDLRPSDVPVGHASELYDLKPLAFRARRLPPLHDDSIRTEIHNIHRAGVIAPANATCSFTIVINTKKDMSRRFCVKFYALNAKSTSDRWPLPRRGDVSVDLCGFLFFIPLELYSGYWEVKMFEKCKETKTIL